MDLRRCAECGMDVGEAAVFHPWLYCVMFKAGIRNPDGFLREFVATMPNPPHLRTTDAEQPSPKSAPVSLSVQEGQGDD